MNASATLTHTLRTLRISLPDKITIDDTKYPAYHARVEHHYKDDFELWHVEGFGWCIPTLLIANVGRRARNAGITTERTYAVPVSGKFAVVRIGFGPHVKCRTRVIVTSKNRARLLPYITRDEWGA